ncbi:MAG: SDR family oxidoreductase [Candidatus Rokubacteria bacterium]|nr:SDR family oxidoreductase [Candidatus Rokubacteria bacterium]
MARTVRFVLAKMKPGVTREEYERFEREVDYVIASRLENPWIAAAKPPLARRLFDAVTDPSDAGRFLERKVALVTGASSGTGVDIARQLAGAGARVAVHYRMAKAEAERIVDEIHAAGGDGAAFGAEVARSDDLRRLVADVSERLGSVSVLVNNAGPFNDTPFRTLAEADWDYIMDANLKAAWLLSQLVAPGMERAGWGRIVNIGATSAFVRSHAVYGLAKAALLHLTESLAIELAPAITVNAVVPSQIASPRTDTLAEYKARAIAATPLGRLVTQDEIARMVVLVCSPAFDVVTGRAIIMDGGRTIPRFPRLELKQD